MGRARARVSFDSRRGNEGEKLKDDVDEDEQVEVLNVECKSADTPRERNDDDERLFWASTGEYYYPGTMPFMGHLF